MTNTEDNRLTKEERELLNDLFYALWANRNGVRGSWGANSFRYHPTYIQRGSLLLCGETKFGDLYVINPPDAKIKRVVGDSCSHCSTFPEIEDGEAIRVTGEPGPWWDLLRQELPRMWDEMKETQRRIREQEEASRQSIQAEKQAKLERAAAACQELS